MGWEFTLEFWKHDLNEWVLMWEGDDRERMDELIEVLRGEGYRAFRTTWRPEANDA